MLRLHDSALDAVVELVPRDAGRFSMYVCGPTVYTLPHIGHGRATLTWDVLRRWLTFCGLEVEHVTNVTDIDDNIIAKANREGRTESEVATAAEAKWFEAMDGLGLLRPTKVPHATQFVDQMIETIQALLDSGHAYRIDDGVYLDTAKVPDYGLLAGQPLASLRSGARVEANPQKRSPLDFALWKAAKPDEPSWAAPFGDGRPGWHTECVVMSLALLGERFDLHGGGQDLKFPHHENERAQAVALGRDFANHWIHHGWVVTDGEKMARSADNYTTLEDFLSRSDARAYRLLLLRAHYRGPIEVNEQSVADAERALARLDAVARRFSLEPLDPLVPVRRVEHPALEVHADDVEAFVAAMDDDLDTPRAVAQLFDLATRANTLADAGNDVEAASVAALLAVLAGAVGLVLRGAAAELGSEPQALAEQRDLARAAGDYQEADRLRDELVALGFAVDDTPSGTVIRAR